MRPACAASRPARACGMEGVDVENDVIGRKHQHHSVRIAALCEHGRGGNRGA